MSTSHGFRHGLIGAATLLMVTLSGPGAVSAVDQVLAVAPGGPTWDETSGYGAVAANRAPYWALLAPEPTWDQTSGYGVVEANRVAASAIMAPAPTWDETSRYGMVEAIRTSG